MLSRRAAIAFPAALVVVGLTNPLREARADNTVKACTTFAEDAQRLRAAGKLLDARDKFMACSANECPKVVRTDCAQWASEVLGATPTIVVDAKDAGGNDIAAAKVFVDDRQVADKVDGRPIPIDPGSHTIRVQGADGSTGTQSIVAKENARGREVKIVLGAPSSAVGPMRFDDTPAASGETQTSSGAWPFQTWLGIGLTAVGAIALTYSVVTYVTYKTDESSLREKFGEAENAAKNCASSSPPDSTCGRNIATREDLRKQYNDNENDINDKKGIMFAAGIGGALMIAGGIVLIVTAPSGKSSAPVRGGPIVTPTFAGLSLGGTF